MKNIKFLKKSNKNISLSSITLVAVSSIKIRKTIRALKKSMQKINFQETIFISHRKPLWLNKKIKFIKCEKIDSLKKYSQFMLYDLAEFIQTDFALIVQHDGYVIRPGQWDDHFLDYDYIGAPWPKNKFFTKEKENIRVGNGGFSLRSKKLLNIFNKLRLPFSDYGTGFYNEDGAICVYYKKQLEENGINFAPIQVAAKFSHESSCDDSHPQPFGFHKNKI